MAEEGGVGRRNEKKNTTFVARADEQQRTRCVWGVMAGGVVGADSGISTVNNRMLTLALLQTKSIWE